MATKSEIYEAERIQFHDTFYGTKIFYDNEARVYVFSVWSEKDNINISFEHPRLNFVKFQLSEILIDNFYRSLTAIKDHFGHEADFDNPAQNLEKLRIKANEKISALLETVL